MLKGLIISPKKEIMEKKELNLRPQEGSLTEYWITKKNVVYTKE